MAQSNAQSRRHILTVNLEDYFQVGPVSAAVPLRHWPRFETRVEHNAHATLDLLDEFGHKATFFVVGWIAERYPVLMQEIVRRGHEVASKGYYHRSLRQMSPEEFEDDAVKSRNVIEQAAGVEVRGYRIARGWLSQADLWALEALSRAGYAYDSSLRLLGFSLDAKPELRRPIEHTFESGTIIEQPLATYRFANFDLPISGGNYLRQLPENFVQESFDRVARASEDPQVFYFHSWELDPDQPRISGLPRLSRMRQYRNLEDMTSRIRGFLQRYEFGTTADALKLPAAAQVERIAVAEAEKQTKKADGTENQPVSIIVPCYNEEQTLNYLGRTLDQLQEDTRDTYDLSFVFVDDGSADKTFDVLQKLFGHRDNCQVLRHDQNKGIAAACLTGFQAAKTETVCVIDADCTFDPAMLTTMIPLLTEDVAMVTASPYHSEGGVQNVPAWRLVLSRGASKLYRHVLTNKLASYTACFRVYRRSAVLDMKLQNSGFTGITEILARLDRDGKKVIECPAILETRLLGQSKMKVARTIGEHIHLVSQLMRHRQLPPGREA